MIEKESTETSSMQPPESSEKQDPRARFMNALRGLDKSRLPMDNEEAAAE